MLPCQRKSRSQSKMGRAHKFLKSVSSVHCPNCSSWKLPHAACTNCGYVRPGLKLNLNKEV